MFDRIKNGLWWDKSLTLVEGCTPISPGCDNCWSAAMAHRFGYPAQITDTNGRYSGQIFMRPERLDIPLKTKKPTVWAVWNDLHHPNVPDDFIAKFWAMADKCKQHIFLVLTKRPEKVSMIAHGLRCPRVGLMPSNVWYGVTAENQEQADKRIPILLQTPAAVHFVSAEPLLGPLNIRPGLPREPRLSLSIGTQNSKSLDWVICGGESGPHARPMHPEWARSLRDQCKAANVTFFFKQIHEGKKLIKAPFLDGRQWLEVPDVREWLEIP